MTAIIITGHLKHKPIERPLSQRGGGKKHGPFESAPPPQFPRPGGTSTGKENFNLLNKTDFYVFILYFKHCTGLKKYVNKNDCLTTIRS